MRRAAGVALVCSLLLVIAPPAPAETPGAEELGEIGNLALNAADTVASAVAGAVDAAALRPPANGMRVLLVSSGVDLSVFPTSVQSQISFLSDPSLDHWVAPKGTDPVGYGTYAASQILQLVPDARISVLNIYNAAGRTSPGAYWYALYWASFRATQFDVMLPAVPPTELLDPISAAMATGEWDSISDSISGAALRGLEGDAVFGAPMRPDLITRMSRELTRDEYYGVWRFRHAVAIWNDARERVRRINQGGISVVVPAGDHGPDPQTIPGIANLPEIIAVGGADRGQVSAKSSSGPGIDGSVKPDLVAPTGLVGLLPSSSILAKALAAKNVLDPGLALDWSAGEPNTQARGRLDTSLSAAVVVAVATGGLAAAGVRDPAVQRGALFAASQPIDGVPVWRQGAGLLERIPDKDFATSRSLVTSHASLGREPDAGDWSATVPVVQGSATGGVATVPDYIGINPDATNDIRTASSEEQPQITVTADEKGVSFSTPAGSASVRGGLWCGYGTVSLGTGGVTVPPPGELAEGAEQVALCLVKGFRVRAQSFYIHNLGAEDTTFTFSPALPPGAGLLDHALHFLPLNPLDVSLFGKVTEAPWGYAFLPNLPPGYYKVRQFSDYGSPVVQTVTERKDGSERNVEQKGDVGANPAYVSMKVLILPPVGCVSSTQTQQECAEQYLKNHHGEFVEYDKPTTTYLVGPKDPSVLADNRLRVAINCPHDPNNLDPEQQTTNAARATCFKKMIATNVTSRVIDHIPFEDLHFFSSNLSKYLQASALNKATGIANGLDGAWEFQQDAGAGGFTGVYNLAQALSSGTNLGLAAYPFNLTTPNYSAHMSLNFRYELTNAFIVVIVQMGRELGVGVVTPDGTFRLPPVGSNGSVDLAKWLGIGHGKGTANFEFRLLPRGAPEGILWVLFVPPANVPNVSAVSMSDLSFELDTWTNVAWPATKVETASGTVSGHNFSFDSRFNAPRRILSWLIGTVTKPQISDPPIERVIDNGWNRANVSEDWVVMVHSPGDDAALYELCDVSRAAPDSTPPAKTCGHIARPGEPPREKIPFFGTPDALADNGSKLFDPRRGVTKFKSLLAFNLSLEEILAGNLWPTFRANGRFWEQLAVPMGTLRYHSGPVEVRIVDDVVGRKTTMLEHVCGPPEDPECEDGQITPPPGRGVEVSPYVPFISKATYLFFDGWSAWESMSGVLWSAPDAASWGPGHADVFVRGSDNGLWYRRHEEGWGWGWWVSLGAPPKGVVSAPGAASPGPGRTEVYVRGADNKLWGRSFAASTGAWSAWASFGAPCAGSTCVIKGGPDAASPAAGRVDVFAQGADGAVWQRTNQSGVWSDWSSLGAPPPGLGPEDPSAAARAGRIDLFARGADGNLWHRRFSGAWGPWTRGDGPLTPMGGGMTSGPDSVATDNGLHVFARGPDNGIWRTRFDGSAWSPWEPLGGVATSDPGVVSWGPDRFDLFARGADNALWHKWCCG